MCVSQLRKLETTRTIFGLFLAQVLDKNLEAISLFILFVKQKPVNVGLQKDYICIKKKSSLLEDFKCDSR